MYEEFTRERIIELRLKKDKSARDMSLDLGQNDSYINRIENKKIKPSLTVLFNICDYFGITPKEFFDEGNPHPERLNEIIEDLKLLDDNALALISGVVKEFANKKK